MPAGRTEGYGPGGRHSHQIPAAASDPIPIRPGETLQRDTNGGDTQIFSFELLVGQYAQLVIRWHDLDLNVVIRKPDQTLVFPTDIPVRGFGPIPVAIVADQTGPYRVEISTVEQIKIAGSFDITVSDVRYPDDVDRDRFAALSLMAEGQGKESPQLQIEKYLAALQLWESASDPLGQAYAHQRLGKAYIWSANSSASLLPELLKAKKHYAALIKLRESLNDPRSLIYTRREIGQDYRAFDSAEESINYYQPALQLAREIKDRKAEAALLYSIGFAQMRPVGVQAALESFEGARRIQHEDNDRLGEASTLNVMGAAYGKLGDQAKALELYEQAAMLRAELRDDYRAAIISNNIALAYDDLGDFEKAREKYYDVLSRYKSLLKNDLTLCKPGVAPKVLAICNSIANTSDNLGELYNSTGDPQSALETFEQSLALRHVVKQPQSIGSTLTHIGYSHLLLGQPLKAIEDCNEALKYNSRAKDKGGEASSYTVLGMAYMALSDSEQALKYYEDALRLQQKVGERRGEGITLEQMGRAHAARKDMGNAFQCYEKALELWRAIKDQEWEARTLYDIANAERQRGNLTRAREYSEAAIQIVEYQRGNLSSRKLRTSYFANKEELYELDIDIKMQLSREAGSDAYLAAALESSEKARARTLVDLLTEVIARGRGDEFLHHADTKVRELVERKLVLRGKLNAKGHTQTALLAGQHDEKSAAAIAAQIDALTNEYDEVETEIRTRDVRYAELVKPQPLSLDELQRQLDDDTLLLEFALGDKRSYVWVVSQSSIRGFELVGREEIEAAARRVAEALTARNRQDKNEPLPQRRLRLDKAEKDYPEAAAALSKMVLERVAPLLGQKRLLIVADGALQFVPFTSLPAPRVETQVAAVNAGVAKTETRASGPRASLPRLLVEDHEIVSLASASVLAVQRREFANRKPASLAVAVFADPVFDLEDERVAEVVGKNPKHRQMASTPRPPNSLPSPGQISPPNPESAGKLSPLGSALRDVGLDPYARMGRLTLSRQEATAIAQAAPAKESFTALDFAASRKTATSPELSKYRIVHFATHGVLDLEHPELSGIVLSMVDEKGRTQDGYLRLHEIYNLNLPAELVVLSACETGIGKQVKGEGLIALTRGFMYAGAERVVASLWKVDDVATSALMAEFYKQMFTNKLTPAAALRAAQLEISKKKQWQSPYYWAGFVIQGEWKE